LHRLEAKILTETKRVRAQIFQDCARDFEHEVCGSVREKALCRRRFRNIVVLRYIARAIHLRSNDRCVIARGAVASSDDAAARIHVSLSATADFFVVV
jgi:hypothetical protein